jgi:hypothetical protein
MNEIDVLLKDKSKKSKQKVEELSKWILENKSNIDQLIEYCSKSKGSAKATCIEALEFATREEPDKGNEGVLMLVIKSLEDKDPRIKWESAKVLSNIVHLHKKKIGQLIHALLPHVNDKGTVVRWAVAQALSAVLMQKTIFNKELLPAVQTIVENEEKASIKKVYLQAVKKIG